MRPVVSGHRAGTTRPAPSPGRRDGTVRALRAVGVSRTSRSARGDTVTLLETLQPSLPPAQVSLSPPQRPAMVVALPIVQWAKLKLPSEV